MIESLQNPKVKTVMKLRDRRGRKQLGQFLIEGYRELSRAKKWKIDLVFYCEEFFLGGNEPALLQGLEDQGVHLFSCTKKVFKKLSYRDRPDGLLAIAPIPVNSIDQLTLSKNPFVVVAEAIEKPGNLGTILRTCDAVGADALIVCDACTDLFNPNVVRASVGTLFTVPVAETSSENALQWLTDKGIAIAAATPHAEKMYTDIDLSGPVAIILGTEQYGLSEIWMNQATLQARIPMMGEADSLNVAIATSVMLYEGLRQRTLHR